MRRKAGGLLDIEARLLGVLVKSTTHSPGAGAEMHGFGLAKLLADGDGSRRLTGHGTLYKALSRLESAGLVVSRWEDEAVDRAGRPRRRLYRITADGRAALATYRAASVARPQAGGAGIALP